MTPRRALHSAWFVPILVLCLLASGQARSQPTADEQAKLDQLDAEIDGGIIYHRGGRIYLVLVGDWDPIELGPGRYARWSPDGQRIAVLDSSGNVYVMDADGANRTQIASGGGTDNCPLEFHTNGEEIIWLSGGAWKATDIVSHATRDLMANPPHSYTGEASISADGSRLACRASHDLYAIDLASQADRKYADGCSAGISPDGARVMNNISGHEGLEIRDWDGGNLTTLHAANGCSPDGSWDNHHWSNHADFIAGKGDGSAKEAYVLKVSQDTTTRVTWVGDVDYPDLFVGTISMPDPLIGVDPSSLSFAVVYGTQDPDAQTVSVSNIGGATLGDVVVTESAAWLTVSRSGSGDSQVLTNQVSAGFLPVDTYTAQVGVSGGGASNTAYYSVSLLVTQDEEPRLSVQPAELVFSALEGGEDPPSQQVRVSNAGTGFLDKVTTSIDFGASPGGWLQVSWSGTGNGQVLDNQVLAQGLAAGSYFAEVTVECANAANSPVTYVVELLVAAEPTILVNSPGTGDVWQAGSEVTVTWTTVAVDDCAIKLSLDGGNTFPVVLSVGVDHTSQHWLNWPVTVPLTPSTQCVVLVEDYNQPYPALYGMSGVFSIVDDGQASVTLSSPVGGETLAGNTVHAIQWSAQDVDSVVLEVSLDGGVTWEPAIATVGTGDADWGNFAWDVPNVVTDTAVIRAGTPGGGVSDQSGEFRIEPEAGPSGDLNVTLVKIVGRVPEEAGGMGTVTVAGVEVEVGADGEFEAEVEVPLGVERLNFEIAGSHGDKEYSRLVQVEVEDVEPPIDGLGVSAKELIEFVGGRRGVLTWVDAGGQIRVLDFRVDDPAVALLSEEMDCVNPLVSPDGTRVVYSQGRPNGPKTIKVRRLSGGDPQVLATGDVGYWRFAGGQEAIVWCDWSDKAENGADGKTWLQVIETGDIVPSGEAVEMHDRAMDAGPNGSGRWLGQVYLNLWAYDLDTGTDYPTSKFFLLDDSPADHQTCNGSMSPDESGRMMCLVIPHDYVRVFSYEAGGDRFKVSSEFDLPSGMVEWEFPEWSTDVGYLTAVLRASDLQNRLFVVKMGEGKGVPEMLEITGEERGVSYSHLFLSP